MDSSTVALLLGTSKTQVYRSSPFRATIHCIALQVFLASLFVAATTQPLTAQTSPLQSSGIQTAGIQTATDAGDDAGWNPLFNGVDLSGWVLVNTPQETWSFREGVLACTGKPIGEIRTERMYQNFVLEIEWRHLKPAGNAGIFVWADDITARGVPFHRGVEVQVLEDAYGNTRSHTTHGDIFPIHGATMKPLNGRGGSRAFPTEERSKPSPEWNHYRIVCNDGDISLAVNGKVVTRGTDASPRKGYICLESEGGEVEYRNGRIRELPATAIEEDQIAIANRGYRSLYTGLDLSGWNLEAAAKRAWQPNDWILKFDGSLDASKAALTSEPIPLNAKGFLFDFRGSTETQQLRIAHPLLANPLTFYLSDTSNETASTPRSATELELAKALVAPGGWNRIEIALNADEDTQVSGTSPEVTVSVNGKPFTLPAVSATDASEPSSSNRSVVLTPTGPVDFANLFTR